MAERIFATTLFLALGIVTFQEVRRGNLPPRSSPYVGVALVFTVLGVLSIPAPSLAAAFGVVADLYLLSAYGLTPGAARKQSGGQAGPITGQLPQLTGASAVGGQ